MKAGTRQFQLNALPIEEIVKLRRSNLDSENGETLKKVKP